MTLPRHPKKGERTEERRKGEELREERRKMGGKEGRKGATPEIKREKGGGRRDQGRAIVVNAEFVNFVTIALNYD